MYFVQKLFELQFQVRIFPCCSKFATARSTVNTDKKNEYSHPYQKRQSPNGSSHVTNFNSHEVDIISSGGIFFGLSLECRRFVYSGLELLTVWAVRSRQISNTIVGGIFQNADENVFFSLSQNGKESHLGS